MYPYYCIFCLLSLLAWLDVFNVKYKQRIFFLFLIWCLLSLFAGLRINNPDYDAYSAIYSDIAQGEDIGSADIGFNVLCKIIALFSHNPVSMFLIVACLSTAFNLNSFRRYSSLFLICVLYYFVHFYVLKEMIQIRAGLASAICLYGIRYLTAKKYKQFLVVWIIAISIHFSAVVWFFVLLSLKLNLQMKTMKRLFWISLIIGLYSPLGQYIKLYAGGIDERLSAYIAYGNDGYASKLGVFTNLNTLKSIILLIFVFCWEKKLFSVSVYFKSIIYSYMLGVCWLLLFNDFAIIGARISNILMSVEPILVSYLFLVFSKNSRWLVLFMLICVTYAMLTLNMAPDKIIPYQSYLLS